MTSLSRAAGRDSVAQDSGQAAAEFAVAAVAILAAVVGVLSVGALVRADSDAMDAARERAAAATRGGMAESTFPFVAGIDPGRDGIFLTPDDRRDERGSDGTRTGITRALLYGGTGEGGGESATAAQTVSSLLEENGRSSSTALASFADASEAGASVRAYALRKGEGEADAVLPPAAWALFGIPGSVRTKAETWMPATGGL